MYKMAHFTGHDKKTLVEFIRENSFALVTGMGAEYPAASHLPLEIIEEGDQLFFTGHLMRNTDHHKAFENNDHVLVVFSSPHHAIIKAAWYAAPAVASTINYMAVHVKGKITFTGEEGTYAAIKQLTDKHIGTQGPGSFDSLPKEYIDSMLKAIVGFKIEVMDIQDVFKLSQNRNTADQQQVIKQLEKTGQPGPDFIAAEMKKRL